MEEEKNFQIYGNCRSINEFNKMKRVGEGTYGVVCNFFFFCLE